MIRMLVMSDETEPKDDDGSPAREISEREDGSDDRIALFGFRNLEIDRHDDEETHVPASKNNKDGNAA